MLIKGNYFTTFNLTSGYYHTEIHSEHRKFLGFEWTFENDSRYIFSILCFTVRLDIINKSSLALLKTIAGEGH